MTITKAQEQQIKHELSEFFDVSDVYFHKGILYVQNSYDIPAVEDYLETSSYPFCYKYVEDEPFIY